MTEIEWPKGSGRKATYSKAEMEFMHEFGAQAERGEITDAVLRLQIGHLHDLKIEFGVDLVADVEVPSD